MPSTDIESMIAMFEDRRHDITVFMNGVRDYFSEHPLLNKPDCPSIHSCKSRVKDVGHLRKKLERKISEGRVITTSNFFQQITDLCGVRILHLYKEQLSDIDQVVRRKISDGDWVLGEMPKAYTWDPENVEFFKKFDLEVAEKPTSYTSVHYLVKPRPESYMCCEIQVRTLFEEIWGEVDHQMNYPEPTTNIACREQIKVLSKLVGAGSRLLDSLQKSRLNLE